MSPTIRLPLLGLLLVAAIANGSAGQHLHGGGHLPAPNSGHLGQHYQPFWGFGRPTIAHPVAHPTPAPIAAHPHPIPAVVGFGPISANPGFVGGGYSFFGGPSSLFFGVPQWVTPQFGPGGLWLSQPSSVASAATPNPPARPNPARATELVELGDRAFRGGNYRKAEERYQLAIKADGEAPLPHVRLAQVALIRANYARAASHLREAVAGAGGGWLLDAPDIQSLYGEPREFARRIAQLESHLQAHPEDADGWFVLGAQQYLSGHPREANDAFVRLADRPVDPALTAFQDAATVSMRSLARGDAASRETP